MLNVRNHIRFIRQQQSTITTAAPTATKGSMSYFIVKMKEKNKTLKKMPQKKTTTVV